MLWGVGEGVLSPLPGLGFYRGAEPSAHALGYHLTALRAWGHGLGTGLRGGTRPTMGELPEPRLKAE